MKTALQIIVLCGFLALTACNSKRPQSGFKSREIPRGPVQDVGGDPASKPCGDTCAWGKFYGENSSSGFEEQAKRFASVSVPKDEIGYIDYNFNGTETGVWFWGEIPLQGGNLNSFYTGAGQSSLSVTSNSRLAVVIYDSHAVQATDGLKPIVSYFAGNRSGYQVTGSVTRQGTQLYADIRFNDSWGAIRLQGYITSGQGGTFDGQVSYVNSCSMTPDGNCSGESLAPNETVMGRFKVEACRFFYCQ